MVKLLFSFICFGAIACGSSSDGGSPSSAGSANGGGSGVQTCPDVNGNWKVTQHCDPSLVGMTLGVTETNCMLTFSAPFNQFMGSVTSDDKITLSGPQSCTGTVSASEISMVCTPGTCTVTLAPQ
ncbi:MAG TPA: hypothetical protein VGF76_07260 [Polyangiaceae bacterium]|jgi:hypothetical protein